MYHEKFDRALRGMHGLFLHPRKDLVILLTGASGVGKSEITKILEKKHAAPGSRKHIQDLMPVVRISAKNQQDLGRFSIKDLWANALRKIKHPLVANGASVKSIPTSELWYAFELALTNMQTKYLIIDEAQHIRKVRGGDANAQHILDALKCLAEELGIVLVLSGAYPLMSTVDLGPQLSRRTYTVVLHRYYASRDGDLAEFSRIVEWCSAVYGLDYRGHISSALPEIYHQSRGVFGMVDNLMFHVERQIDTRGIQNPCKALIKELVQTQPLGENLKQEIEEGETYLAQKRNGGMTEASPRSVGQAVEGRRKSKKKAPRKPRDLDRTAIFE
jgi:hypothetical protein